MSKESKMKELMVIRADADTKIGSGHVMRCLALAQAWQETGGRAVFTMTSCPPVLEKRLKENGIEVIRFSVRPGSGADAGQTTDLAQKKEAVWIIVDGYCFNAGYQRKIKEAGFSLLLVDDLADAEHYYADIVLNQNLHGSDEMYQNRESSTVLLLGPYYALLRREFLKWQGWQRKVKKKAQKILVTMGGGDPNNVTLKVIQALQQVKVADLEAAVVIGGSNPHLKELREAARSSSLPIRLETKVTNMPELMAWADIAVATAGSTCWELAFMGLPGLLFVLADNQRLVAESLGEKGAAVNLGWYADISSVEIARVVQELLMEYEKRSEMCKKGREMVDGEGAARVIQILQAETLRLRPAEREDCLLLWEWANDPEVRAVSFSTAPVSWQEHIRWFQSKLDDPNYLIFMASNRKGVMIGQIRYELEGKEAMVSVNIIRDLRGQGYGSNLIKEASKRIFTGSDVEVIHAYAKPGNVASEYAFLKAGFRKEKSTFRKGQKVVHLVLRKENLL